MGTKIEIIKQLNRMLGYVPVGVMDLLSILAHPDVIKLTYAFLDYVESERVNGNKMDNP